MLISVICCVTGRAAVAAVVLLGDSALAAEELFSVASMIWMAEASEVGLLVTLLEAPGRDQIPLVLMRRSRNNQAYKHVRSSVKVLKERKHVPIVLIGLTPPLFCLVKCSL